MKVEKKDWESEYRVVDDDGRTRAITAECSETAKSDAQLFATAPTLLKLVKYSAGLLETLAPLLAVIDKLSGTDYAKGIGEAVETLRLAVELAEGEVSQ